MQQVRLQELKEYTDGGLIQMWTKLREVWADMGTFCSALAQAQEKQGMSLGQQLTEIANIQCVIRTLTNTPLPEFSRQVQHNLETLGMQFISSCNRSRPS